MLNDIEESEKQEEELSIQDTKNLLQVNTNRIYNAVFNVKKGKVQGAIFHTCGTMSVKNPFSEGYLFTLQQKLPCPLPAPKLVKINLLKPLFISTLH